MEITMSLQILDIDLENVDYCLIGKEVDQSVYWKKTEEYPVGEDYKLEIETDKEMTTIRNIKVGLGIQTKEDDIRGIFLESLLKASFVKQTEENDGFEHTHDVNSDDRSIEEKPYDPKRIRVDTKTFAIDYICRLITSNKIDISPDFQREIVWTEVTRKSRLIESIMLRIPIPIFYLSQDLDGKFQVVDGIQRLTVISEFVNNKFKLKNLEYLTDLNGKWFCKEDRPINDSIPSMYAERIEQTQLIFNIIDPDTPEQVKYDIFRRINTGGKTLNQQEIRNCLSNSNTRKLLSDMTNLKSFLDATDGSISKTRMADKEIVLRFIGFYLLEKEVLKNRYSGNMDEFLDHVIVCLNKMNASDFNEIFDVFDQSMKNAFTLFGKDAFRKPKSRINKALFLSWSRVLSYYKCNEIEDIIDVSKKVKEAMKFKMNGDKLYLESISASTNDTSNIMIAFDTAKRIMEEIVK